MEPNTLKEIANFLAASGPYGLVAIVGWAYYRSTEKKDGELRSVYGRLIRITEAQVTALTKVEAALTSLKEAIERIGK